MKPTDMKDPDVLMTLASDDDSPHALRDATSSLVAALSEVEQSLEDPFKQKITQAKGELDRVLATMGGTGGKKGEGEGGMMGRMAEMMKTMQRMLTDMAGMANDAHKEAATTRASITGEVEKAIGEKTKVGELVAKADHEQAVETAVTTARAKWEADAKTVNDRRTTLASASLPIPADDKLAGKDEEFKARQEQAKARAEALKLYKVPTDKLVALCWDSDQASFDMAIAMAKENMPATAQKPNGFIGSSGTKATATNLNCTLC